jgi:arylsulfatase A-like enzyme
VTANARHFLLFTLMLALWTCHCPGGVRADGLPSRPPAPNLLIIVADDQSGLCLGAAGDTRGATPNLDTLARQGVLFEKTFCNSPLCTPSRQSFITGLLPHAVGVTRLATPLPQKALTLGRWLSVLGYRSAAIGKMHFNGPSHHGFEVRIDSDDWLTHLKQHPPTGAETRHPWKPFVDPPAVWLNARCNDSGLPAAAMESTYFVDRTIEYMKANRDHPFALVVSFYEPHAPFRFPREWLGRYRPKQFQPASLTVQDRVEQPKIFRQLSDNDFRGIQAAYYTSLSFMDAQIGRLLQALHESDLGKNTLVVFLSDNGYLLGQHGRVEKHCFYEPAVRVPMIMRWPGHLPEGKRVAELVELVDVFPTLCSLLSVPKPPVLHGVDLVPLIEGKSAAKPRDVVFSEYTENEEAMARSTRYKLIVGTGRRDRKDHLETGLPLSGPYQRLFDLEHDPDETTNLSEDLRFDSVREDLLGKLHARFVSTWTGPEPIPPGLSPLETIHWCLTPRD